jgi:molybdenum-dependent DNA-binding transcriptional regulator ModE
MEASPWRDRVHAEEELVEQLRNQMSQSAKRRADALLDGVAELGSVYAVAKELGRSETAVSKAIKKHRAAPAAPETTE